MEEVPAQVYAQLMASDLLSPTQKKVAGTVAAQEDITGPELNKMLGHESAHKRLSELQMLGVIYRKRRRLCAVSGKMCNAWAVTGKMPVIPTKEENIEPTLGELQRCVDPMRRCYLYLMTTKDPAAANVKKLTLWIQSVVEGLPVEPEPPQLPAPPVFQHDPLYLMEWDPKEEQKP